MTYFLPERIFSINLSSGAKVFGLLGAFVSSAFSFFYGSGRELIITTLLLLMVMDWITGIVAAKKDGVYTSAYGIEGVLRSIVLLMYPALGNLFDNILQTPGPGIIFYTITFGLLYHIGQSMTANAVRCKWDKWIPSKILDIVWSEVHAKTVRTEERQAKLYPELEQEAFNVDNSNVNDTTDSSVEFEGEYFEPQK